jgi:hypothetical protein
LGKLEWQGIELSHNTYFNVDCSVFHFTKGIWSRKNGYNKNKIKRSLHKNISFEENSRLILNDLSIKEPSTKQVKKIFDDEPELKSIFVVCPKDDLNKKELYSKHHFDKMNIRLLSDFTKDTVRNSTTSTSRLLVFKFDMNACVFRQVSFSSIKEDPNKQKVLCTLAKVSSTSNIRRVFLKSQKYVDLASIKEINSNFANVSFYGIDDSVTEDRIKTDFDGFINIEELITDKIVKNKSVDFIKIKFIKENKSHVDHNIMRIFNKLRSKIVNKNNIFIRVCELQSKFDLEMKNKTLLELYEKFGGQISKTDIAKFAIDNPSYDICKMIKELYDTYPLTQHLNYYGESVDFHIINYINMVDKIQEIKK